MNVETALKAIDDWYEGDDYYVIKSLSTTHEGSKELFEQSEIFINVYGVQYAEGMYGDLYVGTVWFEYEYGKYIVTEYHT